MKSISKSQFNLSLQCEKAFWLYRHEKELIKFSSSQLNIMGAGTSFGRLMQQLFPGGIDVSLIEKEFVDRIALTKVLLADRTKPIYEATLTAVIDNVPLLCMVDILVPGEGGWHIYEVKAATDLKPQYIPDAGFQQFVAKQSGLNILSVNIVHVNNKYERNGALEINKLGKIVDITDKVAANKTDYNVQLKKLEIVDNKGMPDIRIGTQCHSPYTCGFKEYCWVDVPKKDSVFSFFKGEEAFELYNKGLATVADIPINYPISTAKAKRFEPYRDGNLVFHKAKVNGFLNSLKYPIYYMDFETFSLAVPVFDGSRPYEAICFQYSVHIQHSQGGDFKHKEFLADGDKNDPRIPFIESLIKDMGTAGSVVIYTYYEKTMLKAIAKSFPQYKLACANIIGRMVDLYKPFRSLDVYHPKMRASASLKAVLPALIPNLSYAGLEVSDGMEASAIYGNMVNDGYDESETARLRKGLLDYCELDTWAMVELVGWLQETLKDNLK